MDNFGEAIDGTMNSSGNDHLINMVKRFKNGQSDVLMKISSKDKEILEKVKIAFNPKLIGFNELTINIPKELNSEVNTKVYSLIRNNKFLMLHQFLNIPDYWELSESESLDGFKLIIPNHYIGEVIVNQFVEFILNGEM